MATPDLEKRLIEALARPGRPSTDYDLNKGVTGPKGQILRPAAVLIAICPDTQTVFLTQRSAALKHHPGQIAFPGGKQDPGDPTPIDAALREAEEEIGLPRGQVRILGQMPEHETVTGFLMTPIVGLIEGNFTPTPKSVRSPRSFRCRWFMSPTPQTSLCNRAGGRAASDIITRCHSVLIISGVPQVASCAP